MLDCFSLESENAIPIAIVPIHFFPDWIKLQSEIVQEWLSATQFRVEANAVQLIPSQDGRIERVICCISKRENLWDIGSLPFILPEGLYTFEEPNEFFNHYAVAWGLGAYQFTLYKKPKRFPAQLCIPSHSVSKILNIVESIHLVRDLVNIPTDDMGPSELAAVTETLAKQFKAKFNQIVGKDLLTQNYPCIHTVGRASDDEPRLLDLRWGNAKHPKITLVGKGVCFDTGGLDLKPAAYMTLMKKDMGGAAHVLGLARMIMEAKLPINLRVLIPAVENSISGNAYRPGDIIKSRKGLTIEIGNTDAEGRVILADALTEAINENPDLLIDITTLTGAARVALGTELPAVFSNDDEVVNELIKFGEKENDFMWRMPLFEPYREHLNSQIADINNNSSDAYGGAISAALFLKEFVPDDISWLHFDLMAWNTRTKPGRPQGGEAFGLRALFSYLVNRYPAK